MSDTETNESLKARIAELEREVELLQELVNVFFDQSDDGVCIQEADGSIVNNDVTKVMFSTDTNSYGVEWKEDFGFFKIDRTTRLDPDSIGTALAIKTGKPVKNDVFWVMGPNTPNGVLVSTNAWPLPSGRAVATIRDVTERHALDEALAQRDAENRQLIDRLRVALDELSTPVLEVAEDVLVLPVIGLVDTQRSAQMSERLLSEVVRTQARFVIIDLTGVDLIDTSTADRFAKVAQAVRLLGARCVLSGIQPGVSQTLVELGVDLGSIETQRNLRHALEWCGAGVKTNGRGQAKSGR